MSRLRRLLVRLVSLTRGRRLDAQLDEEIASHLALAIGDHIARGMSPEEARLAALREFGGVVKTREAYRDVRGLPALDSLWQDTRYAIRSFRRTPVFTAVAILSLTLAIGANTAIFSLLNALVLRDLPARDPDTLVQVATVSRTGVESGLSYAIFQALTRHQQVFSSVVAWWGVSVMTVDVNGVTTSAAMFGATENLYSQLGVRPFAGRLLTAGDMDLDAPRAAQTTSPIARCSGNA